MRSIRILSDYIFNRNVCYLVYLNYKKERERERAREREDTFKIFSTIHLKNRISFDTNYSL